MTPQQIRDAIAASPELQALGANTQAIADILSVGRKRVISRIVSARGVASDFPAGPLAAEGVLLKLEGAAAQLSASAVTQEKVLGSLIARQLKFLAGEGLDFGSPALRSMLGEFAVMGILTTGEVDGLKSLALVDDPVTHTQVGAALRGDI
jgi:hypothetical protein